MEEIGIRELKARASEVVRAVRERRVRYLITQRGRPVALLVPLDALPPQPNADEVWARLERIREELGKGWQSEKSAVGNPLGDAPMNDALTIDASVFVNAFTPSEPAHRASKDFLLQVRQNGAPLIVPTLVIVEIAAAIGRGQGKPDRGMPLRCRSTAFQTSPSSPSMTTWRGNPPQLLPRTACAAVTRCMWPWRDASARPW
jgi:prevent-host-death family protein